MIPRKTKISYTDKSAIPFLITVLFSLCLFSTICGQTIKLIHNKKGNSNVIHEESSVFYFGFTVINLKFSTYTNQRLITVEELIPQEALNVPVHSADGYAEKPGVEPFSYDELNNFYSKLKPFQTAGIVPKIGFHILPIMDLECSYDFINLNLTRQDFLSSVGMDQWPDQRDRYYMHKYLNGADAFTVIRFKNKFSFNTLSIKAIFNFNEVDYDKLGLVLCLQRNFLNVTYQAQSGWDRYYKFEMDEEFPEVSKKLTINNFSLGIIYGFEHSDNFSASVSFLFGYSRSGFQFAINLYDLSFDL